MFPLFETIKLRDGRFFNLTYHNARLNLARKKSFNCNLPIDLADFLYLPTAVGTALHKCKVIYKQDIEAIKFEPYFPRKIQSLKLINIWDIDYSHKYLDRDTLNDVFQQKGNCDDVLMVKNGLITDTSYGNIIFFDGMKWVTPNTPLLCGTKRAFLLEQNIIEERSISVDQLTDFKHAKIVNAMLDMEDTEPILIKDIGY